MIEKVIINEKNIMKVKERISKLLSKGFFTASYYDRYQFFILNHDNGKGIKKIFECKFRKFKKNAYGSSHKCEILLDSENKYFTIKHGVSINEIFCESDIIYFHPSGKFIHMIREKTNDGTTMNMKKLYVPVIMTSEEIDRLEEFESKMESIIINGCMLTKVPYRMICNVK